MSFLQYESEQDREARRLVREAIEAGMSEQEIFAAVAANQSAQARLAKMTPDEIEQEMFQMLACDPDARAEWHRMMGYLNTGIEWLVFATVGSLGIAAYCWATRNK